MTRQDLLNAIGTINWVVDPLSADKNVRGAWGTNPDYPNYIFHMISGAKSGTTFAAYDPSIPDGSWKPVVTGTFLDAEVINSTAVDR